MTINQFKNANPSSEIAEESFWNYLESQSKNIVYGSDNSFSLFGGQENFNLNDLDTLTDRYFKSQSLVFKGVNKPFVNIGTSIFFPTAY